jgi:hypothetical protein
MAKTFSITRSSADIAYVLAAGIPGEGGMMDNLRYNYLPVPQSVTIDIQPGDDTNCFDQNGNGVTPVAILGNPDFDVTDINTGTLLFDSCELRVRSNPGPVCSLDDVNNDGLLDLVCQFRDRAKNWRLGDGEGTVTGALNDSTEFQAADSMCVVPKN